MASSERARGGNGERRASATPALRQDLDLATQERNAANRRVAQTRREERLARENPLMGAALAIRRAADARIGRVANTVCTSDKDREITTYLCTVNADDTPIEVAKRNAVLSFICFFHSFLFFFTGLLVE